MGGLFDFYNINKPGPGVPKNEPPKPRIVLFFQIYARRFSDLVKLNMLFTLFNIPALLLAELLLIMFFVNFQGDFTEGSLLKYSLSFAFCTVFSSIPIITTGPAQAGFTYVLRNYTRQEHAFTWWDFKEHALKNFKQGLLISLIDFFVLLFIFFDIYIYIKAGSNSLLLSISIYSIILFLIIFMMMHFYIYPILVTFDLSLKHIYKNAFIFAMIKFLPNMGILVLCLALSLLPFIFMPVIATVLFPFITLSTIGFITNFYVYPSIEKYMIKSKE